jgi:hypothetical protein
MKKLARFPTIALSFAASLLAAKVSHPAPVNVTLKGIVTCAHCGLSLPKGATRFSWAYENVSKGDGIVLIVDTGKGYVTYQLDGHRDDLMRYLGGTITVTGDLEGTAIEVFSVNSGKEH